MLASGLATRWLKRGARSAANGSTAGASEGTVSRLAEDSRRELLATISDFLLEHDLAVCPENLTAAWTALSGASPSLARRIAAQTAAGEPITQKWLQEACGGPEEKSDQEASRRLTAELDRSLSLFARSTSVSSSTGTSRSSPAWTRADRRTTSRRWRRKWRSAFAWRRPSSASASARRKPFAAA